MALRTLLFSSLKLREIALNRYFGGSRLHANIALRYFSANRHGERLYAGNTMEGGDPTPVDGIAKQQMPVVQTNQGLIRGCSRHTIYNDSYQAFEGIPYAQPPVGELRFKSPLPAESWSDVRDCLEFEVKPMQKNYQGEIEGSEDCLYLNVYVKELKAKKKLPVMVWIYGGAFNTGGCIKSKYGPDYFMQKDVILVTFNYRLSVLGFLSLKDPALEVPGNAGLKDQILALKWVKDNIGHFGGDSENVTLFGESAGAAAVHYLLCADNAKGLFHKAICMSGCVLNNWAFSASTTDLPYKLACSKGYKGKKEDRYVLEFLQNCPAQELLQQDKLNAEAISKGGFYAFIPSLEPYESSDTIARKPLLESMKSSWGNEIPLIIGGNSFEGLVRYPIIKLKPEILDLYKKSPKMLIPHEVLAEKSEEEIEKLGKSLMQIHFQDTDKDRKKLLMDYLDYCSFHSFWHGLHRVVLSRLRHAKAPTFQYLFDFDSPTFNHHRKMFCGNDIEKGVAHADDLGYIFYSYHSWKLDRTSDEFLTIQRMVDIWTGFAKTSNPNCKHTKDAEWKPLSETNLHHWFKISNDLAFEEMPAEFKQKLQVWNDLYGEDLL
ncbi:esterase B1 [Stomoxys calcitrans]|uniref:esterase B1 n=1 Tax=Stomoxys calcitrans TaxID=35570 RepID=UPI0027E35906|nr:esterase B1 [Stomoxys calcitrans]